jgi:hypothetical protein
MQGMFLHRGGGGDGVRFVFGLLRTERLTLSLFLVLVLVLVLVLFFFFFFFPYFPVPWCLGAKFIYVVAARQTMSRS